MSHALVFDLGTTNFKAAVVDPSGRTVALTRLPTPTRTAGPGRFEMTSDDLLATIRSLVGRVLEATETASDDIEAIAFASQANTFVLMDARDRPLTPLILWNDRRADEHLPGLDRLRELPDRAHRTGNPRLTPEHMIAKLASLREHDPAAVRDAARICTISSFLNHWLTGRSIDEASLAFMTGLFDVHQRRWSPAALDAINLDPTSLPEVCDAGVEIGKLRPAAANALGLPLRCRVVTGCLDQFAGAIGAGIVKPGQVCETTGTVLSVVRCSDLFVPGLTEQGVWQGPGYEPGVFYQMDFSSLAANLLESYRKTHAPDYTFEQLDREAAAVLAGDANAASRYPLDVKRSESCGRPVFHAPPTPPGHAVLAIMQAVAERLPSHLDRVCGNDRPAIVTCLGGAGRSKLWRQLKQERTGLMMRPSRSQEPALIGAAVCARSARSAEGIASVAQQWTEP